MTEHKSNSWSDILPLIKPFDVILFCGKSLVSHAIIGVQKYVYDTKVNWSHCGIVVNKRIMPSLKIDDPDLDKLYIWESTLSTGDPKSNHLKDVETGKYFLGVHVRDMNEIITNDLQQNVGIAWCNLINNPMDKKENETDEIYNSRITQISLIVSELHIKYNHRPYDLNVFRMLGSLYPRVAILRSKLCCGRSWIFCSELVSMVNKELGLYPATINSELVTPNQLMDASLSTSQKLPSIYSSFVNVEI